MDLCNQFEWFNIYVVKLRRDVAGILPSAPPMGTVAPPSTPPMGSDMVAPPMGVAEVRGELKKLNKHLRQMNHLFFYSENTEDLDNTMYPDSTGVRPALKPNM